MLRWRSGNHEKNEKINQLLCVKKDILILRRTLYFIFRKHYSNHHWNVADLRIHYWVSIYNMNYESYIALRLHADYIQSVFLWICTWLSDRLSIRFFKKIKTFYTNTLKIQNTHTYINLDTTKTTDIHIHKTRLRNGS